MRYKFGILDKELDKKHMFEIERMEASEPGSKKVGKHERTI